MGVLIYANQRRKRNYGGFITGAAVTTIARRYIVEVLWRLPPKSLIRLHCVCKDLHFIMSSKRVIRSHLQLWSNRSDETGRNILVKPLFDGDPDPVSRGIRIAMELVGADSLDSDRPHHRRSLLLEESGLHWGGCCKGIIRFYEFWLQQYQNRYHHRDVVIYICNPVLKQCRVATRIGNKDLFLCSGNTKVCFVLDCATEEYKVVLVSTKLGISIFSLKTGFWKEIHHIGSITKTDSTSDLVLHDESLYWMISGRQHNVLYAMDIGREIIRQIKLPHDLLHSMNADGCPLVLVRYKGSLAVSSSPYFSWLYVMMKQDEDGMLTWKSRCAKMDLPCICGADRMICDCDVWKQGCRIPSAATSFDFFMPCEDCVYVGNGEDGRVDHKFVVPAGRYNNYAFQKCLIADYVPSLASVFPPSQSVMNEDAVGKTEEEETPYNHWNL